MELGYSKNQSSEIVELIIELIKSTLESGEDIMIAGFGRFCVKEKNPRRGRNPTTGDDMMLDARKVAAFKCSDKLREKINGS